MINDDSFWSSWLSGLKNKAGNNCQQVDDQRSSEHQIIQSMCHTSLIDGVAQDCRNTTKEPLPRFRTFITSNRVTDAKLFFVPQQFGVPHIYRKLFDRTYPLMTFVSIPSQFN